MQIKTGRVVVGGLSVAYRFAGLEADRVVVFLHGWGLSSRSMLPLLESVGDGVGVLAIDFPGHGDSDAVGRPFVLEDFVDVLRKLLVKKIGGKAVDGKRKKIVLVGHSFGGRVIVKMLAGDVDWLGVNQLEIAQIVFAGVPFFREQNLKVDILSNVSKFAGKLMSLPGLNFAQNIVRKIGYRVFGVEDYAMLRSDDMRQTFRKVVGEEIGGLIPQMVTNYSCVPIDMIWGAQDLVVRVSVMERAVGVMRPLSQAQVNIYIIQSAGHVAWNDQREEFLRKFKQILSSR